MDGRSKSRRRIRSEKYVQDIPPLHDAAQSGDAAKIKMLVENGAEVNEATKRGDSPVIFAASSGHCQTLQKLIECGANLNFANSKGQ